MRNDLAQKLVDLKPSFVRFPGGKYLLVCFIQHLFINSFLLVMYMDKRMLMLITGNRLLGQMKLDLDIMIYGVIGLMMD